ncbi:MAG: acyltransferase family protein [Bdellovibrionota bacterium]
MKYFPEIDRLRGVAILLVIFHHLASRPFGILAPFVDPFWSETWVGVDLFFVISGFVVARSLAGSEPGAFYRRRFWRIAPSAALWAVIPLLAVLVMGGVSASTSVAQIWHDFLGIISLTFNYSYAYAREASLLLSPYWSLCVEEHFYLVLPLLFLAVRGRRGRIALGAFVILLTPLFLRPVIKAWIPPPHPIPYFRCATHCRLDGLFLGVLLAELGLVFRRGRFWGPVAVLLLMGMVALPNWMSTEARYNWGLSFLALLSGGLVLLASQNRGWVLEWPFVGDVLRAVGKRSYALYLTHVPAYFLAVALFRANGRAVGGAEAAVITGVYGVILAALALGSYRWVERPLRV